jgi:hypothetical protein
VLRGERPEVTERVAEAGNAVMSAMKAFVAAAAQSGAHREPADRPRPAGVQRIDLGFTTEAATGDEPDNHVVGDSDSA